MQSCLQQIKCLRQVGWQGDHYYRAIHAAVSSNCYGLPIPRSYRCASVTCFGVSDDTLRSRQTPPTEKNEAI